MELLKEVNGALKFEEVVSGRDVNYKVFEDNNGHVELAKCPKLRPRTKHSCLLLVILICEPNWRNTIIISRK